MSDIELVRFDNVAIQKALHEESSFSEMFVSHLLARNARAWDEIF